MIALLTLTIDFLSVATAPATAQTRRQVATVAILGHEKKAAPEFDQALHEFGYREGQNISIEKQYAHGNAERLADLAADFAKRKVAVIVAVGPLAVGAAAKATATIPIVMLGGGDPVRRGFVKSLTAPGGNVTGLSGNTDGAGGKRLELFKESIPSIRNVALLLPPTRPGVPQGYIQVAQHLGLVLQIVPLVATAEIDTSLAKVKTVRPDALMGVDEVTIIRHARRIAEFASAHRLPSMFESSPPVHAGGLMSYGPNEKLQARRAAVAVDKILKGTKPSDIPIEPSPMKFVVNLRTAKQLGVAIPPQILLEADEVIK